jgi:hypothetical protein
VLYNRRQSVLRALADDNFLLEAVTAPSRVAEDLQATPRGPSLIRLKDRAKREGAQDLRGKPSEFFNDALDEVKRSLLRQIHSRRPLFVVQGPPGTGKTTLAAEVILQLLAENPSARILVASQAHDPLNNLLEVVNENLERLMPRGRQVAEWQRPMIIRLMNRERLDENVWGKEATRVGREFNPSTAARKAFKDARGWKPEPGETIDDPAVLEAWHQLLDREATLSATFEQRIVNSANLIFATANDRHIARLRDDSFDLVVFEEAAKAYGIELLSAMRLARRWLLIGDQYQLPPFGIEDFMQALKRAIERFKKAQRAGSEEVRAGDEPLPVAPDPYELRDQLKKAVEATAAPGDPADGNKAPADEPIGLANVEVPEDILGFESTDQLYAYVKERATFFEHLHRVCDAGENGLSLSGRLTIQWRMHPVIGNMVREIFYEFLRNGTDETGSDAGLRKEKKHPLTAPAMVQKQQLLWIDTPHVSERGAEAATEELDISRGRSNGYEARALLGFFRDTERGARSDMSVAILSPYRAQVRTLENIFRTFDHPATGPLLDRIFTVDSFQGRQANVVAVSLVRNNEHKDERRGIGFLADKRRAAVMFSRAESLLIVVGCSQHFKCFQGEESKWIYEVYQYIEQYGQVVSSTEFVRPQDEAAQMRYYDRRWRGGRR